MFRSFCKAYDFFQSSCYGSQAALESYSAFCRSVTKFDLSVHRTEEKCGSSTHPMWQFLQGQFTVEQIYNVHNVLI